MLVCDGSIVRLSEGETIRPLGIFLFAGQLATLLEQTGWVARVVLVMLLAFSLFSWALIFQKSRMFSRINQQTSLFLRIFRSNRVLPDPKQMGSGGSPLETLYSAGYREVDNQIRNGNPHGKVTSINAVTVCIQITPPQQGRKPEKFMPSPPPTYS